MSLLKTLGTTLLLASSAMAATESYTDEYNALKTAVEIVVIVANGLFFIMAIVMMLAFLKYYQMKSKSRLQQTEEEKQSYMLRTTNLSQQLSAAAAAENYGGGGSANRQFSNIGEENNMANNEDVQMSEMYNSYTGRNQRTAFVPREGDEESFG